MAYKKNGKYTWKGRRYHKYLSTRNIFGHKGSKSQAKQIYALRKSINKVAKMCKPEVKEVDTDFNNRLLGQYFSGTGTPDTVSDYITATPMPSLGTGDDGRIGNVIRLYPMKFKFSLQYGEKYGTAEGSTIWNIPQLTSHGMQVRLIVVQTKASINTIPTIRDIFEEYPTSSDNLNTMSNMVQQFKPGITSRFEILYNRVFSVSQDKPMKSKSVVIKPVIRTAQWEEGILYPRGQLFLYFLQGGAVSRMIVADPNNFYDYNYTNIMFKMVQPYSDA